MATNCWSIRSYSLVVFIFGEGVFNHEDENNIWFFHSGNFLLGACSEKTFEPKSINAETDICKICNMSIAHEDYAGQIVFKNGDYEMFDDIGCLMEFMQERMNRK